MKRVRKITFTLQAAKSHNHLPLPLQSNGHNAKLPCRITVGILLGSTPGSVTSLTLLSSPKSSSPERESSVMSTARAQLPLKSPRLPSVGHGLSISVTLSTGT
ncbi:hypothetical protein V8G54_015841 [Vigna mungo]|uniref:Uncharacterized protein n=1 Tax=Vigna mungo TaxID=3915 RepID=A0AAQ3S0J4_VIGMU